jgi:hypothetical protein
MERLKRRFTSERWLILEAFIVMGALYFLLGFEITVLSALGVIAGHVMKISLRYPER